jgi:outer membrane protein assembly factor BamA
MNFNGQIDESDLVLSYMYLPHRWDFGIAAFNFYNEYFYYSNQNIYKLKETQYGANFLIRYPVNRFLRFDFDNSIYQIKETWEERVQIIDVVDNGEYIIKQIHYEWKPISKNYDFLYVPRVGFVFDNALYGITGPLSGAKLITFVQNSSFSKNYKFTTLYNDWRMYTALSHRVAIANRFVFGFSEGKKNPQKFNLKGVSGIFNDFNGVRGYNNDFENGNRKMLTSLELRFPLIDVLNIAFPLPLQITQIRGSAFTDIGAVWNAGDSFQGVKNGDLKDIKMGVGFGPRMNLGFVIIKFDIAWSTNLNIYGKPSYYITINEDF